MNTATHADNLLADIATVTADLAAFTAEGDTASAKDLAAELAGLEIDLAFELGSITAEEANAATTADEGIHTDPRLA